MGETEAWNPWDKLSFIHAPSEALQSSKPKVRRLGDSLDSAKPASNQAPLQIPVNLHTRASRVSEVCCMHTQICKHSRSCDLHLGLSFLRPLLGAPIRRRATHGPSRPKPNEHRFRQAKVAMVEQTLAAPRLSERFPFRLAW